MNTLIIQYFVCFFLKKNNKKSHIFWVYLRKQKWKTPALEVRIYYTIYAMLYLKRPHSSSSRNILRVKHERRTQFTAKRESNTFRGANVLLTKQVRTNNCRPTIIKSWAEFVSITLQSHVCAIFHKRDQMLKHIEFISSE